MKIFSKIKLFFKRLLGYLPESLPTGMTAYNAWQAEIIELVGPIADDRSLRWAIANMVMHAPNDRSRFSKNYFVRRLVKTAANQLSAQVFNDIKAEQEAQKAAANAAIVTDSATQPAAATAPSAAAPDVKETTNS